MERNFLWLRRHKDCELVSSLNMIINKTISLIAVAINLILRVDLTLRASSGPPYSQGGTGKYGFESDLSNRDDNEDNQDDHDHDDNDDTHAANDEFTRYWRILPAC